LTASPEIFLVDRGSAYFNNGDYERAIADFDASLRHWPNGEKANTQRGVAQFVWGKLDAAASDFQPSLAADEHPHWCCGSIWRAAGRSRMT
jgi:tetratricopeptide (TPR) repeat protein